MMDWPEWKQRDEQMVREAPQDPLAKASRSYRKRRPYHTQVAGVLAAAFTLSLAYSAIVTVTGSHEGYGLGDPALWVFYAVGFGVVALALVDRRWTRWVVAATVLALIAVGIFYYPTLFPPSAQTTFAWFENDVYVGLLILAEYLCVQRLRNVLLAPER
jgi:cytochrome bd-type quinol oxidase subunit 2